MGKEVRNYPESKETLPDGRVVYWPAITRVIPPLVVDGPTLDEDDPELVAWHQGGPLPKAWSRWIETLSEEDRAGFARSFGRLYRRPGLVAR